ncbi:MAG: VOC family protein [Deltaproteobacteria bacterium]|jgi:methylmalonyl-CoA/ethylmalonyl-CoA epimerase|nr:VOC family protein [Deltaproteobacteria bacterium]MBW2710952.1 VOC family protein [Deltaproteobacteria bacterium]
MISRIDHISIAVNDYANARHFFEDILGAIPGAGDKNHKLKYHWQIFSFGDLSRLELISSTGEESFLSNFFKKNKNGGFHHISLQTPDIQKTIQKLEDHNISYFGYNEYADFWKEIFIHPKDAFGVLIQIAEFDPDDWLDKSSVFPKGQKWEVDENRDGCTLSFAHPGGGKVKLKLTKKEIKRLISELEQSY